MWIFRFRQNFRNIFRLIAIILIIINHYLRNWFTTGPLRFLFDRKGKKRISRSERLRYVLEDLGPTFIKFGQILADRPDMASESLRLELKKLQSSARPFDDDIARKIIEDELGDSIDNFFESIEDKHLASASIAQIYRARLKTGEEVVIKVQRPRIRQKIKLDLILIQIFARKIRKSYPELSSFNIESFVTDFGEIILKELDFTNEMSNMLRLEHLFKDDETCHIPKVYSRYSTTRLLVMEFIEGESPDNVALLIEKGFSPQKIAENGMNVILTMILRYGFFHADPHPGNIFIRGNNQIVLIDHGMCATLRPKQIDGLLHFLIGFADKNPHKIAKALIALTEAQNFREIENLEFDIHELIQKYSYLSYSDIDVSSLFNDTFRLLMKYEIKVPSSLYMLIKTLVTIQNLAEQLHAKLSIVDMIRPYAREKILEKFTWKKMKNKVLYMAEDYFYLLEHLPRDIRDIVSDFKTNGLRHQISMGENGITNNSVNQIFHRLGVVLLLGFMLLCSTLLKIYNVHLFTNLQGKSYYKTILGNFPDYFFVATVTISAFIFLKLIFRKK
ncbi:MAG: AarF/UbiB family protein [Bacteroidota bacterium]